MLRTTLPTTTKHWIATISNMTIHSTQRRRSRSPNAAVPGLSYSSRRREPSRSYSNNRDRDYEPGNDRNQQYRGGRDRYYGNQNSYNGNNNNNNNYNNYNNYNNNGRQTDRYRPNQDNYGNQRHQQHRPAPNGLYGGPQAPQSRPFQPPIQRHALPPRPPIPNYPQREFTRNFSSTVPASLHSHKSKPKMTKKQASSSAPNDKKDQEMIPNNRPSPTEVYLKTVDIPTTRRETPAQLLIILDLNGTLLCRASKGAVGSSTPTRRPGLAYFLEYLFKNHKVMVWTSARPENATRMVNACFTQVQKESLLALWARDTLGLTKLEYNAKTQVYKTLERVWEGEFQIKVQENVQKKKEPKIEVQKKVEEEESDQEEGGVSLIAALDTQPEKVTEQFTQFNTVLFDDSIEKARAHPYNLVCVPEFTASSAQKSSDEVLWQCIEYLEELKWQTNVTNYIRHTPFEYQPKKPKFLLPGDVDTKKKKKKNKKEKQEKQEAAANASGSEESQETGAWMETGEASRHQNSASSEGSPMMG